MLPLYYYQICQICQNHQVKLCIFSLGSSETENSKILSAILVSTTDIKAITEMQLLDSFI